MKRMIKDAIILLLITILAGGILGFTYEITKDKIVEKKVEAKNEACKQVFKDAISFEKIEEISSEEATAIVSESGYTQVTIDEVLTAKDANGTDLGYVISITDHEAYNGDIQFYMGIKQDGTLNGISILSISETAGLGMNAEDVLVPQFRDKKVEKFEYTKTKATADDQIDVISGATITSNAFVNGVNAGLDYFYQSLENGGGKNE